MAHSCTAPRAFDGKRCPTIKGTTWVEINTQDGGKSWVWVCPKHAAEPPETFFTDYSLPMP